ncbi:hypothetical protein KC19_VG038800 [Ceratodon purpureus]|uniref:Organic hydroperoxide resistance protein n=1 Tax=Ceratodon purpureus TaxID=3225 RepID=A0A8T0HLL6_CERPU|nr:hypothetical protein KC19_N039400 [Ceratodon purpureus]KAG0571740.1 hypothetical protein KC19_VG038800 [Ceratodon purpureus]
MLRHTLRRLSSLLSASRREFATKTLFTAQALVKGGRADGDVTSDDGNLKLTLGLPKGMGGPGKHTNPEQLFAAGYAACFQGAIGLAAKNNKAPVKGSSINSHVSLRQDDSGALNILVKFEIKLDGVDKAIAEKVIKDAHQICPYSRATRGNIDFKYTVL